MPPEGFLLLISVRNRLKSLEFGGVALLQQLVTNSRLIETIN